MADVAKSLGIHEKTISNWVNKAKERKNVPERAELETIRKDNAQLQMDNASSKKSAAWFASENK